jgi:hypothetical protein
MNNSKLVMREIKVHDCCLRGQFAHLPPHDEKALLKEPLEDIHYLPNASGDTTSLDAVICGPGKATS